MAYAFRVWLEREGKHVIGKGGAEILEAIDRTGSITRAAKNLRVSYKFAWDCLAETERNLGQPIIRTRRGGSLGGGGAELTDAGRSLLREYKRVEKYLSESLSNLEYWEWVGLKISARNQIKGTVKEVNKGVVTTSVKIAIAAPAVITAVITKEAADELDLKPNDSVRAIIKATEVMISKE